MLELEGRLPDSTPISLMIQIRITLLRPERHLMAKTEPRTHSFFSKHEYPRYLVLKHLTSHGLGRDSDI